MLLPVLRTLRHHRKLNYLPTGIAIVLQQRSNTTAAAAFAINNKNNNSIIIMSSPSHQQLQQQATMTTSTNENNNDGSSSSSSFNKKIFSIDEFPTIPDQNHVLPALEIPTNRTAELRKTLSHVLLRRPRTSNVYKPKGKNDNDNNEDREMKDKRLLVLANEKALEDPIVKQLLESSSSSSSSSICQTTWKLKWTYDDMTTEEVLRSILPLNNDNDNDNDNDNAATSNDNSNESNNEIPTSFESVGTIAHINLRSQLLPYKYWIGKVLLDKNKPSIKTVVNKLGNISNEYRTFGMEVIAGYDGPNWSVVTVKEEGTTFDMDFTKVYWNSRLSGEHRRLVHLIQKDQQQQNHQKRRKVIVADLMAGIGPFAIPLTRSTATKQQKQPPEQMMIEVYANDLNPDSYKWLVHNSKKNKCCTSTTDNNNNLHCYNMDAREFVRTVLQKQKQGEGGSSSGISGDIINVDHIIMNLPATAPEFLDAFRGYNNSSSSSMPQVHVHCFAPKESESDGYKDVIERCSKALGCAIPVSGNANDVQVKTVRNVAPNKNMVCISFQLPDEVRNLPPINLNTAVTTTTTTTNGTDGSSSDILSHETKRQKTE